MLLALVAAGLVAAVAAGTALVVAGRGHHARGRAAEHASDPAVTPSAPAVSPTGAPARVGQPVVYPDGLEVTLVGVSLASAKGDGGARAGEPLLLASLRVFNGTGGDLRDADVVVRARAGQAQYPAHSVVDGAMGDADLLTTSPALETVDEQGGASHNVLRAGKALAGRQAFELRARADGAAVAVEVAPSYGDGATTLPAAVFSASIP